MMPARSSSGYAARARVFALASRMYRERFAPRLDELYARVAVLRLGGRLLFEPLEEYCICAAGAGRPQPSDGAVFTRAVARSFRPFDINAHVSWASSCRSDLTVSVGATLLLDFDAGYSQSLTDVAAELNWGRHRLVRLQFGPPVQLNHRLSDLVPTAVYAASLIRDHQDSILFDAQHHAAVVRSWLASDGRAAGMGPLRAVLEAMLSTQGHVFLTMMDAVGRSVADGLRPRLVITADDTWPQARGVVAHSVAQTIKFQDGLLVRHPVIAECLCDRWCVWSTMEHRYLRRCGVPSATLAICPTRELMWAAPSRRVSGRPVIVFCGRPDSRDMPDEEYVAILADLAAVAAARPELSIIVKAHPSDGRQQAAVLGRKLPANIEVCPGDVPFEFVARDAHLVIAGVSMTLYQAVALGVTAARVAYGPRPNLGVFPAGVFPVVTDLRSLTAACLRTVALRNTYLRRQRRFVRASTQSVGPPATVIVERLLASPVGRRREASP